MPEYSAGVPMWVDVSTTDLDKSRAFYQGLFGWEAQVMEEAGGYTIFSLGGKMVGAATPTYGPDQRPVWSTYVCSTDAHATAEAAKNAGGQVLVEPMEVMEQGTMAVLTDASGAFISVWQPQQHRGAELVNEPNSFCWNELYTRDMPAARQFYERVFGWTSEESTFPGGSYTLFSVDGKNIAGGMDMSFLPADVLPHWLVYFAVSNAAETAARATELGATILDGPKETPMGPFAVIQDPVGAVFAVIQISHQNESAS